MKHLTQGISVNICSNGSTYVYVYNQQMWTFQIEDIPIFECIRLIIIKIQTIGLTYVCIGLRLSD
jgi:hypothetical protein